MKRYSLMIGLSLSLLTGFLFTLPAPSAAAKDAWVSVRSKNFRLIGNANEADIRQVAVKLEQFREVFSRLFSQASLHASVPPTVIVFKNDASYQPFKPLYQGKPTDVAGYFLVDQDINYITLTAERRITNPYATIFHEYVHALTSNTLRGAPLWLKEGLAEYYSTFDVADGEKKIWLGKPRTDHLALLREKKLLPLQTLFAIKSDSQHYNDSDERSVFYAESWVLVHYLLLANKEQYQAKFLRYLSTLTTGLPVSESFQQVFQTDEATIEHELERYIKRTNYPEQSVVLDRRLEFDTTMQSAPLSEAGAQAILGDLLLHAQRFDEAETWLQQALTLDPELADAHTSLGLLLTRQRRFDEAKKHLQRAIASDSRNYLSHYYYAVIFSREGVGENQLVSNFAPETAALMRTELKRTIELAPNFLDAYHLLAFVNLATGEQIEEAITLLKRVLAMAPSREESAFLLARVYLHEVDFASARRLLEPIARNSANAQLRAQAQSLLNEMTR